MRNILVGILGTILIILLIIFNYKTTSYFKDKNRIANKLQSLKTYELELNYEILKITNQAYTNLDNIHKTELNINKVLEKLENNRDIKQNSNLYKYLKEYRKSIFQKIEAIYRCETNYIPISNASIYLTKLLGEHEKYDEGEYDEYFAKVLSNIFLYEKTLDDTFLSNINKNIDMINKIKLSKKGKKFNYIFNKNLNIILSYSPTYKFYLNRVLNSDSSEKLRRLKKEFLVVTNKKLKIITIVSFLLIGFVIFVGVLIIYLFYKIDEENELLEKLSITDELTELYNRRKFEEDVKKLENPILLLVNIDRFKYYNELYGTQVGDFILKETSKILKILTINLDISLYRLGADDFGILGEKNKLDSEKIAKAIIDYFKNNIIEFESLEFYISVSIGISDIMPLFETADIALKEIKKDSSRYYRFYKKDEKYFENIKSNMYRLKVLKEAIKNDNIIPYFQPIFDNKSKKIVKYEVLARVKNGDKIESIYPYLNIAKENKLYKFITKAIYQKSFERFKNSDVEFSLNISIADLNETETMKVIDELFNKYPKILKNLTFEILEDDAIKNYEILKKFIVYVKSKGCKIALDDFGSGYSNFAHVLNLDIDFLKIDGSLIKFLPEDERMQVIVETIVQFAKKIGIKTIAEFVASEEIYEKVKELNIDCSQGFYLGEPSDKLVGE